MLEAPDLMLPVETEPSAQELRLLIPHDPWPRVFLQNLREFVRRSAPGALNPESSPADFWPDVFVDPRLPWRRFLQSGAYHVLTIALIWAGSRFLALQPHVTPQSAFTRAEVVYYTPSEYLPPLDTGRSNSAQSRKADPEYSAQPIISVPPEADNRSQTIVTLPNIRLEHEVALPDVVALLEKAPDLRMPIGPAPAVPASEVARLAPRMERSVIAPPPIVQATSRETVPAPQTPVIAPPPAVEANSAQRLGDLSIGHSSVIAPAPQLSLDKQLARAGRDSAALSRQSAQVIAPPPAVVASAGSSVQNMVALGLHPAVGAPPDPPAGNRRGSFAATPEGHRGASGAPGASLANGKSDASASARNGTSGLPLGLYVGKTSATSSPVAGDPATSNSGAYSVNPKLIANARPPRASARPMQPQSESRLSEEERTVFGNRKFYSLSLNMPNLNSAGGSWIIRFAALRPDSSSTDSYSRALANASSGEPSANDLSAPSATRKVDPAYPLELMRQNIGGTVILYAVIHADGKVGAVRVLRSADERLDRFASDAIAKWQFQPATKNGAPVDVEATFWIPFRPAQARSNF